jgi:hypothetical protein
MTIASVMLAALFPFLAAATPIRAADAARAYFRPDSIAVPPGTEFTAEVLVSSAIPLNACALELSWTSDILQFVALGTRGSAFDIMKEARRIAGEARVKIEGGSIAPKSGTIPIASLTFRAAHEGNAEVRFSNSTCYAADGKGTTLPLDTAALTVHIAAGAKPHDTTVAPFHDRTPPLIEEMRSFRNPVDGTRLLLFRVSDSESGIKETSVRFRRWWAWGEWREASSPVRLESGAWMVEVRAVDNFGNAAEETAIVTRELLKKLLPIAAILVVALLWRPLKKRWGVVE